MIADFIVRTWNTWAPGMSSHEDQLKWHGHQTLQIVSFLKFLVADDKSLVLGNHRHSREWHKK